MLLKLREHVFTVIDGPLWTIMCFPMKSSRNSSKGMLCWNVHHLNYWLICVSTFTVLHSWVVELATVVF